MKGESVAAAIQLERLVGAEMHRLADVGVRRASTGRRNWGFAVSVITTSRRFRNGVAKAGRAPCQRMAGFSGDLWPDPALLLRALPLSIPPFSGTRTAHDASTPKPGILDIAPYVGGRAERGGGRTGLQAVVQREPAGAQPQGGRGAGRGLARSGAISGRQRRNPARGDRRGSRPGSGPHRGRGDGSDAILTMLANAYLRPGRRGFVQRA